MNAENCVTTCWKKDGVFFRKHQMPICQSFCLEQLHVQGIDWKKLTAFSIYMPYCIWNDSRIFKLDIITKRRCGIMFKGIKRNRYNGDGSVNLIEID